MLVFVRGNLVIMRIAHSVFRAILRIMTPNVRVGRIMTQTNAVVAVTLFRQQTLQQRIFYVMKATKYQVLKVFKLL